MSKKVAIIDYGMGNLFSVKKACELVGLEAFVASNARDLMDRHLDAVVLPGVGAFGDAMNNLKQLKLVSPIKEFINSGKPFVGICLGFQLLFSESEEFGTHEGLNVFKGKVTKFSILKKNGEKRKVPQVGWDRIFPPKEAAVEWNNSFLKGVPVGEFMYFVHSFYVIPDSEEIVSSYSVYDGIKYCSSISRGNVFACQFHPEKSVGQGIQIYKNFADIIGKGAN